MLKNANKFLSITVALGLISIGIIVSFQSCKKWPAVPTVTTSNITGITYESAISGGVVTNDKGSEVKSRGICWAATRNPVINYPSKTSDGMGIGEFTSELTGLTPNTTFYVRSYATNSVGTGYGEEVSFKTSPPGLATVTTNDFSAISPTSAWSGGVVTSDGGGHVSNAVLFDFISGVCWSTSQNPTTSDNKTSDFVQHHSGYLIGEFYSYISGLSPNTTYYVRAYMINSVGTAYGDQKSFKTPLKESPIIFNPDLTYGSVTDFDGNTYKTIQIGTQTWMAQNLKTTKFSDGTPIQNVTSFLGWFGLTTPAYCWYENDKDKYWENYGAMYNWYAVDLITNGGKNICPDGWHVPSQNEISTLITLLGGREVSGGKLKETGTTHWASPNGGATNSSGFTALPAGWRHPVPTARSEVPFIGINELMTFWSSSIYTPEPRKSYYLSGINKFDGQAFLSWSDWDWGFSVRCVKDSDP